MATNQGFQCLVPRRAKDAPFLFYLMQALGRELRRIAAGSTFLEFTRGELKKLRIAISNEAERDRLGELFSSIDDELYGQVALGEHLSLQKRGLVQKLLTGEWRVPESIDALMPGGAFAETVEAAE